MGMIIILKRREGFSKKKYKDQYTKNTHNQEKKIKHF